MEFLIKFPSMLFLIFSPAESSETPKINTENQKVETQEIAPKKVLLATIKVATKTLFLPISLGKIHYPIFSILNSIYSFEPTNKRCSLRSSGHFFGHYSGKVAI
ncbi:MAG: hypothetical protein KDC92_03980 [Bacteroidetes bacterium]|nr:hypothetical protein [Bacteroidota bacterium]